MIFDFLQLESRTIKMRWKASKPGNPTYKFWLVTPVPVPAILHIFQASRNKHIALYSSLSAPYDGIRIDFKNDIIHLSRRMRLNSAAALGQILTYNDTRKI